MPEAWQDNWQAMPIAMPLPDADVVTGWRPMALRTTLVWHHLLLMLSPLLSQCVLVSYCLVSSGQLTL